MLARRIIPTLLYRGDTLVKGKQFQSWRSVGNVQQAARIYAQRGVDELIILDIGATPEGRAPNLELVSRICKDNFCPITVGGGVRSVQDVRDLLMAGADKVAICTAAVRTKEYDLIRECSGKFGAQAIVVSIDCKDAEFKHNWTWIECGNSAVAFNPVQAAVEAEKSGAGEILLTSIDREGMMNGYDIDLIRAVSSSVSIPVIAHGGCGSYQHMADALDAGADGVAAGSLFQFTDSTPKEAAEWLSKKGYEVRL